MQFALCRWVRFLTTNTALSLGLFGKSSCRQQRRKIFEGLLLHSRFMKTSCPDCLRAAREKPQQKSFWL